MVEKSALTVKVREFIADAADIPPEKLRLDANLYKELGIDSLGTAAIFVDLAYEFDVPEPKTLEDYSRLDTPQKIIDYVVECLG
jgi:acyl carrier protein